MIIRNIKKVAQPEHVVPILLKLILCLTMDQWGSSWQFLPQSPIFFMSNNSDNCCQNIVVPCNLCGKTDTKVISKYSRRLSSIL